CVQSSQPTNKPRPRQASVKSLNCCPCPAARAPCAPFPLPCHLLSPPALPGEGDRARPLPHVGPSPAPLRATPLPCIRLAACPPKQLCTDVSRPFAPHLLFVRTSCSGAAANPLPTTDAATNALESAPRIQAFINHDCSANTTPSSSFKSLPMRPARIASLAPTLAQCLLRFSVLLNLLGPEVVD
ncbi:hypothetical protein BRADI_3g45216v3, partial [Brachypodium distachyon]